MAAAGQVSMTANSDRCVAGRVTDELTESEDAAAGATVVTVDAMPDDQCLRVLGRTEIGRGTPGPLRRRPGGSRSADHSADVACSARGGGKLAKDTD